MEVKKTSWSFLSRVHLNYRKKKKSRTKQGTLNDSFQPAPSCFGTRKPAVGEDPAMVWSSRYLSILAKFSQIRS